VTNAQDTCIKGRYSPSLGEPHLRATGRQLPYGITQCYLPPDASERAPPNPSHAGWYSIYLPQRDGRLSWPRSRIEAESGVLFGAGFWYKFLQNQCPPGMILLRFLQIITGWGELCKVIV